MVLSTGVVFTQHLAYLVTLWLISNLIISAGMYFTVAVAIFRLWLTPPTLSIQHVNHR